MQWNSTSQYRGVNIEFMDESQQHYMKERSQSQQVNSV